MASCLLTTIGCSIFPILRASIPWHGRPAHVFCFVSVPTRYQVLDRYESKTWAGRPCHLSPIGLHHRFRPEIRRLADRPLHFFHQRARRSWRAKARRMPTSEYASCERSTGAGLSNGASGGESAEPPITNSELGDCSMNRRIPAADLAVRAYFVESFRGVAGELSDISHQVMEDVPARRLDRLKVENAVVSAPARRAAPDRRRAESSRQDDSFIRPADVAGSNRARPFNAHLCGVLPR